MKKIKLVIVILFALNCSVLGQDVFRTGKNCIHLGGGFRSIGIDTYGANLSYERSVYEIPYIGYIGVELMGEVLFPESEISPIATLRAIYHAGFFRTKVLDIYSGLGVAFAPSERSLVHPDIFLGFRFLPKHSKVGFFAEGAYYGSNVRAGVCFLW
jgi:hypothetical protein